MGTVKRSTDANQPEFKPQCHIFYGTRINDMHDDLPKWYAECLLVGSQTRASVMLECQLVRVIETPLRCRSGFMDDSERLG